MDVESPGQHLIRILAHADAAARTTSEIHLKELDPLDILSYPALTVIKIERQATVEFTAALALLTDPVLAYGAEILGRSLLEAAAQLWRIYGMRRSSIASRRRRAICFEFGSISGLKRSIDPQRDRKGRRLPSRRAFSTALGRASIRERYRDIKGLHQRVCPPQCRGTSSSQISEALRNMSKRHKDLRWAFPMWELASMTSHQTLQRGLAAADQSTMAVVPMSIVERASFLDRLLVSYGVSVELAGRIHMPHLSTFQNVAAAIKDELNELYRVVQLP